MSAAVLRDKTKINELADDRESCLHVLTWTALCFTKHTIKKGSLKGLLQPFNEAYEDEDLSAGELKISSLLQKKIPLWVKFDDRPHLDALIAELTYAIAVRYEAPPSQSRIKPAIYEDIMNYRTAQMISLGERDWLVKVFKRHLEADLWPDKDKAVDQRSDKKSNGDVDGPPAAKRMRLSQVGG